ncbi:hypothetical protein ACL02T_32115, partial [Pseudonocardia sp. RS010]|uniref:hypothetical protein n=1 Tax=Pseudonocardia sp. RS010 TaxID=3385979 RepID=UPI0039A0263A
GALGAAADEVGGVALLVGARPGSWESELVMRLAHQYASTEDGLWGDGGEPWDTSVRQVPSALADVGMSDEELSSLRLLMATWDQGQVAWFTSLLELAREAGRKER